MARKESEEERCGELTILIIHMRKEVLKLAESFEHRTCYDNKGVSTIYNAIEKLDKYQKEYIELINK